MSQIQFDWSIVIQLVVLALPLVGIAAVVTMVLRRRQRFSDLPVDTPPGCATSRLTETLAIAAGCLLLVVFALMQSNWRGLLFSNADGSELSVWGVTVAILAATGLATAVIIALRGAASVSVVILVLTVFGYAAGCIAAENRSQQNGSPPHGNKRNASDLNLVINVGGCNVVGAEMFANGVSLGKTPVRITLSEFLDKVPDWPKAPEPTWRTKDTAPENVAAAERHPRDPHWGTFPLPESKFVRLPPEIEKARRQRKGDLIYVQFKYDGELGEFGGGSSGGGDGVNFSIDVRFHFPKRDVAIARLLNQARLSDYGVNERWLSAAAELGPDAWIAVWVATPYEPEMNRVLDAWARWKYKLDDVRSTDDAWQAFERVRVEVDREGRYVTVSPAGHAVELLAPRLNSRQLVAAAEQLITSTKMVAFGQGAGVDEMDYWSVETIGGQSLNFPRSSRGHSTLVGVLEKTGGLLPSGLALVQAIWIVNEQSRESNPEGSATLFQQQLVPALLRADVERRAPFALRSAAYLGGSTADKFLIRAAEWTRDARWETNFQDFEWMEGVKVNRWFYWAAQLTDAAGQAFRANHQDDLFDLADEIAANLLGGHDSVKGKLPFLFVDDDRGAESIGRRYWPRYCSIVERRSHSALGNKLGYLVALGPAAEPQMYGKAVVEDWNRNHHQSNIVEFIQWQLPQVPRDLRAPILDGIIASLSADAQPLSLGDPQRTFALRELREARFLEMDDAAAVDYVMRWFQDELPESERPGLNREWFIEQLPNMAACHTHLVEALAAAPQPKLRLISVDAIRALPTPTNRELLQRLLEDEDEQVRLAAAAAEEYWTELRSTALGESLPTDESRVSSPD